jgi:hypothetical protein
MKKAADGLRVFTLSPEATGQTEGRQRNSYLFAFIDDMSRLICHAEFYLNERIDAYT